MLLLTERFEADFRSVGAARRAAAGALRAQGLAWLLEDVSTAVSELATNAVLHAHSAFTMSLSVGQGRLRLSVTDGSPALPRLRRFEDPDATTGRGLRLVAAVTSSWGATPLGEVGKQTWCEFPLARRPDSELEHADAAPAGIDPDGQEVSELDVDALLAQFVDDPHEAADQLAPPYQPDSRLVGSATSPRAQA